MPGFRARSSALAVVCALSLAACGGDDDGTIPQPNGEQLLAQLDEVDAAVQRGDCDEARAAALEFAAGVDELPDSVEAEVRQGLVRAAANLEDLSDDPTQCEPDTGATGETGPTTTTEDTTTETTTTETTDETTTAEPDDDGGDDGGQGEGPPADGGGNGSGGGGGGSDDGSSGGVGSGD